MAREKVWRSIFRLSDNPITPCRTHCASAQPQRKIEGRSTETQHYCGCHGGQVGEDDPQPWIDLDIPRATWYRHSGGPPASTSDEAPWLDLGISRRTWYRHGGEAPATLADEAPWTRLGISRRTWYRHYYRAAQRD